VPICIIIAVMTGSKISRRERREHDVP